MRVYLRFDAGILAASLVMSGCMVHRLDRSPAPQVTPVAAWSVEAEPRPEPERPWWTHLQDEGLSSMIEAALAANLDVAAAVARADQARQVARQAGASRLPSVQAEASAVNREGGAFFLSRSADAGLSVAWEVDLFGRLKAAAAARQLEESARAEDVEALRLSLSTQVAQAYYGAVESHRQIALLNTQIETNTALLRLTRRRFDAGIASTVDVLQQEAELAATGALLPAARTNLRVYENQLDVLLGALPDGRNRVAAEARLPPTARASTLGVPSDLLLRRPDLRALRAELVAADASIAVAIAERLPRIALTGSALYSVSARFDGLALTALGSLVQPLLEWGARKAEVERNRALYTERLARFTQAYLVAVGEVENALYAQRELEDLLAALRNQRRILETTVERTEELYTQGVIDYLPVLNANRDLQRVERELLVREREAVLQQIALQRALGSPTAPPEES